MVVDTQWRTLAKTVTWRLAAFAGTVLVVWMLTGRPGVALALGGFEALGKLAVYYFHERIWDRIRFGRRVTGGCVFWLTGLSGAGKTTFARELALAIERRGHRVEHLDGARVRQMVPHVGFEPDVRRQYVRSVGLLASILEANGTCVVVSLCSPHADARDDVRAQCRRFIEIHVATPLEVCEHRDRTGLYERARAGHVRHVAGVDEPYEAPLAPEVCADLSKMTVDDAVRTALASFNALDARGRRMPVSRPEPSKQESQPNLEESYG
jgi:adenylylsulfate kinase